MISSLFKELSCKIQIINKMSELDFEEETVIETSVSNLEQEYMKQINKENILSCEKENEFPNKTPMLSEDGEMNTDSGELSNGELTDLEEGEINDSHVENSTICRFFSLGSCRYGELCRFVHVGVSAYHMFENKYLRQQISVKPTYPLVIYQAANVNPKPSYSNVSTGDAWEQGLQEAKRLVLSAKNKKITDDEFEKKKLYLRASEEKTESKIMASHLAVKRILNSALANSAFSEKKPIMQKHSKKDTKQGSKSPIMKNKLSSQKWVDPWRRSRSRTRYKSRSYSSLSSRSSSGCSHSSSCSSSCDHSNESDKSSPRNRNRPPQSKLSRVFSRTFPKTRNRSLSYSGSSNQSLSPSCSPKRSASRSRSGKQSAFRSYSRLYRSYSRSRSSSGSLVSKKSGKIHLPYISFTDRTRPVATLSSSREPLKRRRSSPSMSPKPKIARATSVSECESSDSEKTTSSHSSHRRLVESRSFKKADDFISSGHNSSHITHPMHDSDSKHSKVQRREKLKNSKSDIRNSGGKDSTVTKTSHKLAPVAKRSKLENKSFDCRDQLSISAKQIFSFALPKKDYVMKSKSPFEKFSANAIRDKVSSSHHTSSHKPAKPPISSRKSEETSKSSDKSKKELSVPKGLALGTNSANKSKSKMETPVAKDSGLEINSANKNKSKMETPVAKDSVFGTNSANKSKSKMETPVAKDSVLRTNSANKSKKELTVPKTSIQEKNSTKCSAAIVKKPTKQMSFAEQQLLSYYSLKVTNSKTFNSNSNEEKMSVNLKPNQKSAPKKCDISESSSQPLSRREQLLKQLEEIELAIAKRKNLEV